MALELPAEEGGACGEAGAYAGEEDEIAFLEVVLFERCVHRNGDGAGGGVAEAVDVDDDAIEGEAEALGGGEDDALVRLVGDEAAEVGAGEAVAG